MNILCKFNVCVYKPEGPQSCISLPYDSPLPSCSNSNPTSSHYALLCLQLTWNIKTETEASENTWLPRFCTRVGTADSRPFLTAQTTARGAPSRGRSSTLVPLWGMVEAPSHVHRDNPCRLYHTVGALEFHGFLRVTGHLLASYGREREGEGGGDRESGERKREGQGGERPLFWNVNKSFLVGMQRREEGRFLASFPSLPWNVSKWLLGEKSLQRFLSPGLQLNLPLTCALYSENLDCYPPSPSSFLLPQLSWQTCCSLLY